jgi:hypothetical protein
MTRAFADSIGPDTPGPDTTLPGQRGLAPLADLRPKIVIDSREQAPLKFTSFEAVTGTLYSGDYSIRGLEDQFAVERKSVDDLANCCLSSNRGRFEHELHRLRGFGFIANRRSVPNRCAAATDPIGQRRDFQLRFRERVGRNTEWRSGFFRQRQSPAIRHGRVVPDKCPRIVCPATWWGWQRAAR